ncbi:4Fe-4S ferredoxin [Gordonibacter sp. An230]|uniref:4Fe-4S dicluster domain-containing protein n=1 Tax=Gordonibacter sp. An230 TaxID=1965592 RepID=UPI000B36E26C|nr:4Fe-4S dicluster domain-containing protein [Gordonibacter sp. An230]OUO89412.1 4Fe-4S ferredoxin [Gordonibacter sp. An230]
MSYGFYYNMQRCIGCGACQIACKDKFDIQQAGPRPRRVDTFESGSFPSACTFSTSLGCNHCERPACVAACPTGAMFKDDDGLVLHDDEACIGCQSCVAACPYGAPQHLEERGIVIKCDACRVLREAGGGNPVCVDACAMRALDFGDVDELRAKYGEGLVSECVAMEDAETTEPNILIKPRPAALADACRQVFL